MDYTHVTEIARQNGCTVTNGALMSAATTFHVGGPADLLVDIPTPQALAAVLTACQQAAVPFMTVGNGSNLH